MTRSRWTGAALLVLTGGFSSACQAILGGFDFNGKSAGSGGGAGSTSSSPANATSSSSSGATACTPGAMQPCYDGPTGTEDAGACHGGTQTCAMNGTWESCTGEVTPQPKTCASTMDVACDGLPCVVWANAYGDTTNQQEIDAVALDPSDGSLVVAGEFSGSVQFGATTLTATNSSGIEIFVARLSADGTAVWAQSFGADMAHALTVDKLGNIFVGGYCAGPTNVGSQALTKGQFIMDLHKDGTVQWARTIGDTWAGNIIDNVNLSALALAPDGDLVVAGYFANPLDFGAGTLNPPGQGSVYVAKVNSADGTIPSGNSSGHWAHAFAAGAVVSHNVGGGPRVSFDAKGNVYLGVTFAGTAQFDSFHMLTSQGGNDIAVAEYTSAGTLLSTIQAGGAQDQDLDGLSVDPFGTIVIAGQLQGSLALPNSSGMLSATSAAGDGFVAQIIPGNPWPQLAWGKAFGTNGEVLDVGLDSKNNLRVVGWFTGTLALGPETLSAGAKRMMLLADMSSLDGSVAWNRGWIYPDITTYVHLAVSPQGDSFVAGLATGALDFGTGPLVQPGDSSEAWAGRFGP